MAIGLLPLIALLTAALSAIIGMGGGTLLLAALFCFMTHAEAIPTHAAVQLISNSTRTAAFFRYVHWPTVGRFLIGVIPGGILGVTLLALLGQPGRSDPFFKMIVGAYILASLIIPKPSAARKTGTWWDFPLLGLVAGAAAFTVGAIGPLIAPLFVRRDFVKQRLVATKALCQTLLHIAKIPAFLLLRSYDDLASLGLITLLMATAVIPGTLLGRRALRHVSEVNFVRIYKLALLAAGLKILIVDGLLGVW